MSNRVILIRLVRQMHSHLWSLCVTPLVLLLLFRSMIPAATGTRPQATQNGQVRKHLATIADSIGITQVSGWPRASFSPDGQSVVMVVKRGNVEHNTIDYSLLFWKTSDLLRSAPPVVLLRMSSSSNRDAIEQISWLADNESIAFLGEQPGEQHQLYAFNLKKRELKRITKHSTSILFYSMSARGENIAYTADSRSDSLWNEETRRWGVVVSAQLISDLVQGKTASRSLTSGFPLFVSSGRGVGRRVRTLNPLRQYLDSKPRISPDGKYLVVATAVSNIPAAWNEYSDPDIRRGVSAVLAPGQTSWLNRFELVDISTGESRILIDSPLGVYGSDVAWSPDSRSVVITSTFLPLQNIQGVEREQRKARTFTVEVNILTGQITRISSEELYDAEWDPTTHIFSSHTMQLESNTELAIGAPISFRKSGNVWEKVEDQRQRKKSPEVVVEEDMATPQRVFVVDHDTNAKKILLDLNPQLSVTRLGKVEEISWKGTDGHEAKGGLYYPVDYVAGSRYPLVIQTHGWSSKQFMIDGPDNSGYAAQALAGHDVMVIQADDSNLKAMGGPDEAPREVATYEGVIDYLDQRGMINRDRVGIMGFSRSCFFVKYALSHSKYKFAAASVTDGFDAGYLQYLLFSNIDPGDDFETLNGGHPWGKGIESWSERAPGFNVYKVSTPLRIVALNPPSLLGEWEWFALLKRMGRPVEMIYLENGKHELTKPWDRLIAQQGNEQWFRFWLVGEEDTDPASADQYRRWRNLRNTGIDQGTIAPSGSEATKH
jgi:hypothetical protein